MKRFFKLTLWFFIAIAGLYGLLWCSSYRSSLPGYHAFFYTPEAYKVECKSLRQQARIANEKRKAELLRTAVSQKLFPYWSGTRWGYNGTTETPGSGCIACGYFVMTVLRDAGFDIRREKLAQAASEEAIKTLVAEKNIHRYSGTSLENFLAAVRKNGDQLYVVGLDTHIGFLACEKGECWFIHSSGRVIKEKAEESHALKESKYRVTGCLTADEKFLAQWGN